MRSLSIEIFAVICLALQIACFASLTVSAPIDSAKEVAKVIATKAAEKADEVTEVPQTGGIRSTVLHTGVSLGFEKVLTLVEVKYPAARLIRPLAKPIANLVHSGINNMFVKNPEDEQAATTGPDGEPVKKEGFLSKVKSFVKGDKPDDEVEETTPKPKLEAELEPEDEDESKNEKKKQKKKKTDKSDTREKQLADDSEKQTKEEKKAKNPTKDKKQSSPKIE